MSSTRRDRISAYLASEDIAEDFGPAADLDAETRTWRRETLASTFLSYRDDLVVGVGASHAEAVQDAEDGGRISLARHGGDATAAVTVFARSGAWQFRVTPEGVALLHCFLV
ncbi:hypothetical protein ABT039_22960 [Streptomyces lasiicapitis]|uniref:hypothetical protein n=1 Tax=Streptomyces lasiicapitis TaxID=1923961 RepID=UPI00332FAD08